MPQVIPLIPSEPYYSFSMGLDDLTFTFDVRWNSRGEFWVFDLYDSEGEAVQHGNVIMLGNFPLWRVSKANKPSGMFAVVDLSEEGTDATFDDIGTRVALYYYSREEFLAL